MNPTQIRTNVKTTEDSWNEFRASCVSKGSTSGDVLGHFIELANEQKLEIPVISKKRSNKLNLIEEKDAGAEA